jgi:hypothetical protein
MAGKVPTVIQKYAADLIAPLGQHEFIYNGKTFWYPNNVNTPALQEQFLKHLKLIRDKFPLQQTIPSHAKEFYKHRMHEYLRTLPRNSKEDLVLFAINLAAITFLILFGWKARAAL